MKAKLVKESLNENIDSVESIDELKEFIVDYIINSTFFGGVAEEGMLRKVYKSHLEEVPEIGEMIFKGYEPGMSSKEAENLAKRVYRYMDRMNLLNYSEDDITPEEGGGWTYRG